MKKIILKSLILLNFKGIKDLTVNFSTNTEIKGTNGVGKTTIMDAFLFLFFGKDSTDRKDFDIKTLDKEGNALHKLSHEVMGEIDVDGSLTVLKRIFREKWEKRRGTETAEWTGHESLFFIDDVPKQAGEYASAISAIIDENVFKMITNPHVFSDLKWSDRRMVLINIAGEISDNEIAATKPEFEKLLKLLAGKSFEDFKKSLSVKKDALKKSLAEIPARIDEANRKVPLEPDYAALNTELTSSRQKLAEIEENLTNRVKGMENILKLEQAKQQRLYDLNGNLSRYQFNAAEALKVADRERQSDITENKQELKELQDGILYNSNSIQAKTEKVALLEKKLAQLREQFKEKNNQQLVFQQDAFLCPACKRPFETDNIEAKQKEMLENFNRDKLEKITEIRTQGLSTGAEKDKLQAEIDEQTETYKKSQTEGQKLQKAIAKLEAAAPIHNIENDEDYVDLKKKIAECEAEEYVIPDNADLKAQKTDLQARIEDLVTQLNVKGTIETAKNRVTELEDEMKKTAQQLASYEKAEFVADDFIKTKMTIVEQRVNDMFQVVKFRMFNTLINGGIEPTCEALIDGVPYASANSAGRTNAGLDIIRVLCKFYDVSAPVFCDNAESVINMIKIDSQLIRLVATKDKELIIN